MIQSGWLGCQNGRKLWSRGGCVCIYKIEIPIYLFRYFFFGIRYFSVFGIPTSVSVSVTDPGLIYNVERIYHFIPAATYAVVGVYWLAASLFSKNMKSYNKKQYASVAFDHSTSVLPTKQHLDLLLLSLWSSSFEFYRICCVCPQKLDTLELIISSHSWICTGMCPLYRYSLVKSFFDWKLGNILS